MIKTNILTFNKSFMIDELKECINKSNKAIL